jgi:hypothetical protein
LRFRVNCLEFEQLAPGDGDPDVTSLVGGQRTLRLALTPMRGPLEVVGSLARS